MAKRITRTSPVNLELELGFKGYAYIIGIDEAGRGALAGALSIGYCVLPLGTSASWLLKTFEGVTDSKRLNENRRHALDLVIRDNALACGAVSVGAGLIDKVGLSESNRIGVKLAINNAILEIEGKVTVGSGLPFPNDSRIAILCDKGLYLQYHPIDFPYEMKEFVNGELKSLSIAAASILAKVSRDAKMVNIEPNDDIKWGFAQHKGYGTAAHIAAIDQYGVHDVHRKTFAPIPSILKQRGEL